MTPADKSKAFHAGNLRAAEIIMRDSRYKPGSLAHQWAEKVVERERVEAKTRRPEP
jgi:hypothetical protein